MKRKIEFSKLIAIFTYSFLIVSLIVLLTLLCIRTFGNDNITEEIINSIAIYMVTPSFALVGVTNSFYYIKSKSENLVKLKIENIMRTIELQKANPEYEIYSPSAIREDLEEINISIDNGLDNMINNAVSEEPSSPTA